MPIDGFNIERVDCWKVQTNRSESTSLFIVDLISGLESLGWVKNTPYYATIVGKCFDIYDYYASQVWTIRPTGGTGIICFNNHIALGYFPSMQEPSDVLAAKLWGRWGFTWSWVPLGTKAQALITIQLLVEAAVGSWGTVSVRKLRTNWNEFTVTCNTAGAEMNDQSCVADGVRMHVNIPYSFGGGWGMRSVLNQTQDPAVGGGQFELGLSMNKNRNLAIDISSLYNSNRTFVTQAVIGMGSVFPGHWWRGSYTPPCLNPAGLLLTNPITVVAGPHQFYIADSGMKEYPYSGIDGGTSFFCSSPFLPTHEQGTTRYAVVAVINTFKGYLYWRGVGVPGSRVSCIDDCNQVLKDCFPWSIDTVGLKVPYVGNSMPLLTSSGAAMQLNAWVAVPIVEGQESKIVGKLWDAFVLSKHVDIGSEAVMPDGYIYRCVSTRATDWQGAPQASLWLCVGVYEES